MPSGGLLLILLLGVIAIALGARLLSAATRQGYVLCLVSIAVYAFLYVPLAIVVIFSFNDSKLNAEWVGFTLSWYRTLFADQDMLRAAGNSLLIAIVASICATILGTMAGIAMHRYRTRVLPFMVLTPVAMPEILLGVSLLIFFIQVVGTELNLLTVIIAHVTFCIGFVAIIVRARLAGMDESIFEAARDLGASPWSTFRLITLPLIMPGVIAGALMAFTLSIDDFVITFFTAGVGVSTLPLQIYSMIKIAVTPEVNAISTLLMALTLVMIVVAGRLAPDALRGEGGLKQARFRMFRVWVVVLAVALAACGQKDTEVAKESVTEQKPAEQGANELHLYNWNNYIAEETVKRFEAYCKCRLVQDYYSDNEELLAKLAAGATGYDVLVPTGNAVETLIAGGALRALDKSRLPNFKNIKPEFTDPWYDPGNKYSVPYAYSITLIGYNVEKMKELGLPTDTWAVIFDPKYLEKVKGKVTVLDSQRELFAAALIYLGYPVNETDPAKLKEARDTILRAKPYWAAFNASSYIKELTIGNIWLAHGYSNDMFQAAQDARKAKRPFSIGYSTPKQGAVLAVDNMVMHKTGPREDLAYLFINFMLDGKNSAELSNMLGSGNPNAAAMAFIDPEVKDNPAVFPDPEAMKRLEQLRDLPRKERRLMNRMWTEIKVR